MTKETMTLRSALSQSKMLDKKIMDLGRRLNPSCIVFASDGGYVRGTGKARVNIESEITESFQSLAAMIRRREALNRAILSANTTNFVELPKFIDFGNIGDTEKEQVSFAVAISRKAYYKDMLSGIIGRLLNCHQQTVASMDNEMSNLHRKVMDQVREEFRQVSNPSAKQIHDRQIDLENQNAIELLDPLEIGNVGLKAQEAVRDYIANIDIVLGHATEITEITIEY